MFWSKNYNIGQKFKNIENDEIWKVEEIDGYKYFVNLTNPDISAYLYLDTTIFKEL